MQNYILIKPKRGPATLHLGMINDMPERWQDTAKRLLARRRMKFDQRFSPGTSYPNRHSLSPR
jgi:hypothetical protein